MHVTVEDGGPRTVAGDPDHPITVGFLCGKVSNYLDRVYSGGAHPPPAAVTRRARRARGGRPGTRRSTAWPPGCARRATSTAASRSCPTRTWAPRADPGRQHERARDERARRERLERTICATAGIAGVAMAHGVSPEVDPEEWPHARYVIVWGWNPMSTAPHLWRKLLDARKAGARIVVVDPFRSRTARVADEHLRPLPGTDAALAPGDDARDRRRRAAGRGLVPRATPTATTSCSASSGETSRSSAPPRSAACRPTTIARVGREFATTRPALLRLGVGAQRHLGAPAAYATVASLPASPAPGAIAAAAARTSPTATASAVSAAPLRARGSASRPGAPINMSQLGQALTDPSSTRRSGARVLELQPGGDRARPGTGARGPAPRGPVHRGARAVHDRHRRARRRRAARPPPSSSTSTSSSPGATTT